MIRILFNVCLIGIACGVILTATRALTREPIELNRQHRERSLLLDLAGTDAGDIDLSGDLQWTGGALDRCPDGYFLRHSEPGYTGPINFIVFWQPGGQHLSTRVTHHTETPGIGDFIDHTRSDWMPGRDRTTLAAWSDIDNVSGATVTTRAVRRLAAFARAELREACP